MELLPSGIMVPLITPESLEDLCSLIEHVVAGGISSIFILGTTGETLKLEQKQRIAVIKKTAHCLGRKIPFLVGLAAANLKESLELMHVAEEEGSRAGVIIPHLWGSNIMDDLLSSSQGDFLLYNNPALTSGHFLPIEEIKKLAKNKRILGIKDSSGDLNYFEQLLEIKTGRDFKVYYGPSLHLKEVLKKNIDGLVSAYANLEPFLLAEFWRKKGEGLWDKVEALNTLVNTEGQGDYILGLKKLLRQRHLLK